MKQRLYFLVVFGFLFGSDIFYAQADPVDYSVAKKVAISKLAYLQKSAELNVIDFENRFTGSNGHTLFFIFELDPSGYIAVSADTDLPPVIAYSLTNDAGSLNEQGNSLVRLLKTDLNFRIKNMANLPEDIIQQRRDEWEVLLTGNFNNKLFQQWPPEGTTSTGGWLETNWTQSPPYNNFCPWDPVTNQRSVAGCPATAMAQILNYYETLNTTYFTDDDDYHHNYAGRNYWIDDDHSEIDFPSFPLLNTHLDSVTMCYTSNDFLKDNGKAALTFACGVAAHQVYTSQVSGTFGVNQALQAYLRFGFSEVVFFEGTDTTLFGTLSQNMMDARPAHLAVVDPGWTMGHNVVTDGYNTDEYYHLNFGWGGPYNGWYLLPDEIPYGLTVIEGLITDIAYPPVNTGVQNNVPEIDLSFDITPNPVIDRVTFETNIDQLSVIKIEIFDLTGSLVISVCEKSVDPGTYSETLDICLTGGMYLCKLQINDKTASKRFIVR